MLKVLCIHGIGKPLVESNSPSKWADSLNKMCTNINFFEYSHFFSDVEQLEIADIIDACIKMIPFNLKTYEFLIKENIKWTAGMVIQWLNAENNIRADLRAALHNRIVAIQPDLIIAHSFGSVIVYDLARLFPLNDICFMSVGSQINNRFIKNVFNDNIFTTVFKKWYNLYNPHDKLFVEPFKLNHRMFEEIVTEFEDGINNHDITKYLKHTNANTLELWEQIKSLSRYQQSFLPGALDVT